MDPQTLGRYQLRERLGEGGMGVVYRALDPRLDREVAVKLLREAPFRDDSARRRFRQEARALSRLLHPNVATLFDFDSDAGVEFLVLEYVAGEPLASLLARGPLPESRARAIAIEVAEALEAAHDQGVIHRDLKPGNIMITPRGRAKVLDFGLAHVLSHEPADGRTATAEVPRLAGTLPYMAPEQIELGHADPRSDVYALGVVLFEMCVGAPPFTAPTAASLIHRIVGEPAPRLRSIRAGVSERIDAVVARCLEKVPERRWPGAAALLQALRDAAPEALAPPLLERAEPSRARLRSLAVLPFENRSGDAQQEFFADGMTDALIAALAQIGALRVISRTSAMRYKGVRKPLPEIARELGVDAVVEGSALRGGDRVRITVQLVEAATDSSLWARSLERPLTDILALQGEVARAIAEEVRVQLTPVERARLESAAPVNPEAHVAYLQGRFLWNKWSTDSLRASVSLYEKALQIDPSYAVAYAGLADSYAVLGNTNALPPGDAYRLAREAAERGLALDDTRAELHASRAYVARFHDWDWARAEAGLLRALALNPGYATARRWYAQLLSGMARHEEAIAEARRALELDPLSLIIHTAIGDVLFYARRYESAIPYYAKCLEMDPAFGPGHTDLARTLEHLGRYEEALREFAAGSAPGSEASPSTGLAILLFRAGQQARAREVMDQVLAASRTSFVSPYGIASFYAIAGETGPALDWLERAYAERDGTLVWIKVHPRLDGLRGEPRFRALLERMQLTS